MQWTVICIDERPGANNQENHYYNKILTIIYIYTWNECLLWILTSTFFPVQRIYTKSALLWPLLRAYKNKMDLLFAQINYGTCLWCLNVLCNKSLQFLRVYEINVYSSIVNAVVWTNCYIVVLEQANKNYLICNIIGNCFTQSFVWTFC